MQPPGIALEGVRASELSDHAVARFVHEVEIHSCGMSWRAGNAARMHSIAHFVVMRLSAQLWLLVVRLKAASYKSVPPSSGIVCPGRTGARYCFSAMATAPLTANV